MSSPSTSHHKLPHHHQQHHRHLQSPRETEQATLPNPTPSDHIHKPPHNPLVRRPRPSEPRARIQPHRVSSRRPHVLQIYTALYVPLSAPGEERTENNAGGLTRRSRALHRNPPIRHDRPPLPVDRVGALGERDARHVLPVGLCAGVDAEGCVGELDAGGGLGGGGSGVGLEEGPVLRGLGGGEGVDDELDAGFGGGGFGFDGEFGVDGGGEDDEAGSRLGERQGEEGQEGEEEHFGDIWGSGLDRGLGGGEGIRRWDVVMGLGLRGGAEGVYMDMTLVHSVMDHMAEPLDECQWLIEHLYGMQL